MIALLEQKAQTLHACQAKHPRWFVHVGKTVFGDSLSKDLKLLVEQLKKLLVVT
jgi:hypothetical protein